MYSLYHLNELKTAYFISALLKILSIRLQVIEIHVLYFYQTGNKTTTKRTAKIKLEICAEKSNVETNLKLIM